MAVKQYLFRLHHAPITESRPNWTTWLQTVPTLTNGQTELHHTDFLVSLPEDSAALVNQANTLAFASSVIQVRTEIWSVAVFELSSDKDADNTTPLIVLHPYRDVLLAPEDDSGNPDERYFPNFNYPGAVREEGNITQGWLGLGFPSYFLHGSPKSPGTGHVYYPDFWLAVSIARDTVSGRYQQQWLKRAVDYSDYFIDRDDTIVLHAKGNLNRTRFPIWRQAVESLPFGHSGYTVNGAGRLSAQPKALTRRVLNGVSNMAQQRRMFMRRKWAISTVMREWHITCRKLMAWLYWNDRHGWQTPVALSWGTFQSGQYGQLTATDVPWQYLSHNLQFVIDFLNLLNVAQGDTGLIISLPDQSPEQLEIEFQSVQDKLRDPAGVLHRFVVANIETHHELLRHMVDLIASIIGSIADYRVAFTAWQALPYAGSPAADLQRAQVGTEIINAFALRWPVLVNEFYGILCLLMSWELTWHPVEPTRGTGPEDVIRSKQLPYTHKHMRRYKTVTKEFGSISTSASNDFAKRRPEFVPYRTWDVELYDTGYDTAEDEIIQQQRRDAAANFHSQLYSERIARETAAATARAAYLVAWKAERQRLNEPNPDDVWDYRNFRSWEWWKQKAQEPLNLEFALRAIDIPNELLNPYALGLGLARNYIPAFSRYSDANGWNEKNQPSGEPIERVDYSPITVLVRRLVGGVWVTIAVQVIGDAAGDLADHLGENDETYSPRQFWPPLLVPGGTW